MFETTTTSENRTGIEIPVCDYNRSKIPSNQIGKSYTDFSTREDKAPYYNLKFDNNTGQFIVVKSDTVRYEILFELLSEFFDINLYRQVDIVDPFLDNIFKKIDSFIDLTDNWDGEGALGISPETIESAKIGISIIKNSIETQGKYKGLCFKDLFVFVGPVSDGSITCELKNKNRELDIEFNGNKPESVYLISLEEFDIKDEIKEGLIRIDELESKIVWLLYA